MEKRVRIQVEDFEIEGFLGKNGDAGVIITHPHPLYGGDMDNYVVKSVRDIYWEKGYSILRINFRGVGNSGGVHGEGVGEQEDVRAAAAYLKNIGMKTVDLAGYSFGAWVNANLDGEAVGIKNMIMVSPPVDFMSFDGIGPLPQLKYVVCGDKDNYASAEKVKELTAKWNPEAHFEIISGANHFYTITLGDLEKALRSALPECLSHL